MEYFILKRCYFEKISRRGFFFVFILEKGVNDYGGKQETKVEKMSRCWRVELKKKMTESLGEGSEWIMKSETQTKVL